MTNVSPWIIHTLTFSQFASLYDTVHCPFSPRDVVQTSPVHPNPVIWYALSHISLIISSSKQPPYLPIMAFPQPFRDILPCNFHRFRFDNLSIYCHIVLQDHVADIVFVAQPPSIIFMHVTLDHCTSWYCQRHSYRVIFCHRYRVEIFYFFWFISKQKCDDHHYSFLE